MKILLLHIFLLLTISAFSQLDNLSPSDQKKVMDIKRKIEQTNDDSLKIERYVDYEALVYEADIELSTEINKKIIAICEKHLSSGDKQEAYFLKQKSIALNNLGYNAQMEGELKKSLRYYNQALKIDLQTKNKRNLAASYSNIGTIYDYMGDYLNAISYYKKSLKIQQEVGNKRGESDLYNNFGVIYNTLRQYDKSLEYYKMSLKLDEELKDKSAQIITLNNIGSLFSKQNQYETAIDYTKRALNLSLELGDDIGIPMTRGNIGSYFYELKRYDSAQYYLDLSIKAFRAQENLQHLGTFLPYAAKVKKAQGNLNEALKIAHEAYDLAIETGDLSNRHASAVTLYDLYKAKSAFKDALKFYEIYISLENQIQNDANKKQLLGFEFERKSVADSIKNQEQLKHKNTALNFAKKENQINKERIFYLIFGLILLSALIGFVFNRFRVTQRQKRTIEAQKEEVEKQKLIIEEINHQIHDSINYSEMIQQAVLPAVDISQLFEDAFLIYQPKDIVSGDFYWLEEQENKAFFAVADCTGHGIPGAFISMIGTILLNEIYNSKKVYQPNLMMNELSRLIQLTLMTKDKKVLNDGMDLSFCVLDRKTNLLQFAGANNGIYILSLQEKLMVNQLALEAKSSQEGVFLFKIDADKRPVGKHISLENSFTLQEIQLQEGDFVLLLSDGYADQFGGPKGKKFKASQLESLLLQHYRKPASSIKENLLLAFEFWKGDLEQVDDVCVIGVRV